MQLNKLSPIAGLILATMLGACGGGKGDDPAPASAPPVIKVSAIKASSATPTNAQAELQFEGGVCSGGTGTLTALWDFGDGTGSGSYAPHTYDTDGTKTVTVTCTDSAGKTQLGTAAITVASAAMNGFLGKNWTAYASIESNPLPYPVAGLTSSGDIYGVWIRSAVGTQNEVATGTTNFNSASWTVSPDVLTTFIDPVTKNYARSPFNVTLPGMSTAAIDLAVSPNGHAIAAWMAGTKIWYATKDNLAGAWSISHDIDVPVLDKSIKVAINDNGVAAIAYCTSTGAELIRNLATRTPITISNQCDEMTTTQRLRSFDIAIDSTTVYAVGIAPGTSPGKSVVNLHSCTIDGVCETPKPISDELATAPKSLSYSRSPNGTYAAIAWNQIDMVNASPVSNVYASIYAPGTPKATWGSPMPVHITIPTNDYSRPLVAINDKGDAFLAMQLQTNLGYSSSTVVTNYQSAATPPTWHAPFQVADYGLSATDIAIDTWGTGLLTRFDGTKSQVGTFPKTGSWSNLRSLTYPTYRKDTFHYQTMRALPDGRAILATSVYDDTVPSNSADPVLSGYMLLK